MATIRRAELLKVWNALAKKITPENLQWLKMNRSVTWADFTGLPDAEKQTSIEYGKAVFWENKNLYTVYEISFRIQDLLDALADRKKMNYQFGDGLLKKHVIEVAKALDIEIDENANKRIIINQVLKEL